MKTLFAKTVHLLVELIEEYAATDTLLPERAELFQSALITLCSISIGGQRKQFVLNISITSLEHDEEEDTYSLIPPHEKTGRASKSRVAIPDYLGLLLSGFKYHIRDLLKPAAHVECMWINKQGKTLGKVKF